MIDLPRPEKDGTDVNEIAPALASPPDNRVRYYLSPKGFRRLLESLILLFGVILVLRSIGVEPFGVPTGSMAPTLTGDHHALTCPECKNRFLIGRPNHDEVFASADWRVACPNCGQPDLVLKDSPLIIGDRLLVDKNSLTLRDPSRWEVVVFWCPVDSSKPYVKRVVALPGEKLLLQGGDIWINGELSRKSITQAKECLVPILKMESVPSRGWTDRWVPDENQHLQEGVAPLHGRLVDGSDLRFDGTRIPDQTLLMEYVNRLYDERSKQFEERPLTDQFIYNPPQNHPYTVHDFFVEFDVELLEGYGSIHCQLFDGRDRVCAELGIGQHSISRLAIEGVGNLRETETSRLRVGSTHRIEMAFIDRRVTVRVDGREAFRPLDLEPALNRNDVSRPVRLGSRGTSCIVRNFRLYRDVHYRPQGDHAVGVAHELGDDEYFMLGDNSGNSDDSRSWRIPGVPRSDIFGKPFLLHQPSKIAHLSLAGREIAFPWLDWSRIRWIR